MFRRSYLPEVVTEVIAGGEAAAGAEGVDEAVDRAVDDAVERFEPGAEDLENPENLV